MTISSKNLENEILLFFGGGGLYFADLPKNTRVRTSSKDKNFITDKSTVQGCELKDCSITAAPAGALKRI